MVQLPATAAIEYVAACCRTRTKTKTKIGTITKTVRGAYARSPQVQCVYEPCRLSVPSIVARRTKEQKKRQTRPPIYSSAGSRTPFPKFSGYVEVGAHYIFHPSTIWVRPLCTELGPKPPLPNADFAMKQTNICRLSGDIIMCNLLVDWFQQELLGQLQDNLENITDQLSTIKSECYDKKQQLVWALTGLS